MAKKEMYEVPLWLVQLVLAGVVVLIVILFGAKVRSAVSASQKKRLGIALSESGVGTGSNVGGGSTRDAKVQLFSANGPGVLPGCPGPVKNGFDLASVGNTRLSFAGVRIGDTRGITCPPCHLRGTMSDGTQVVLTGTAIQRDFFRLARPGTRVDFCGRLLQRTSFDAWVSVERLR